MIYFWVIIFAFLTQYSVFGDTMVSVPEDKYMALKEKAEKWDESQKKQEEEPPKKPEVPERSQLKFNIINDSGFKAYVRAMARPIESPYELLYNIGFSREERITTATLHTIPTSTFELLPLNPEVEDEGAQRLAEFQIIFTEGKGSSWAQCLPADTEKKIAKKNITFYIHVEKGTDLATCSIIYDYEG